MANPEHIKRAISLLREVFDAHRSPDSGDYLECEKSMCAWCEEADTVMELLKPAARRTPEGP